MLFPKRNSFIFFKFYFHYSIAGPDRLLGEIAYQLDRRILSHVFQGHKRLYGFTLLNIPNKITEVREEDFYLFIQKIKTGCGQLRKNSEIRDQI